MPATIPIHNTERELAADIQAGSKAAFGKLYARYAPALLGFIMKIVPDKKAAEGILQQSFMVMWESRHTIGAQPLFAWALGIARKAALAAANNSGNGEIQNTPSFVSITGTINANGTTPDQKKPETAFFELVYFYGYSIEDAAGMLNMEKDSLRMMLRNAVNNLKTPAR